MAAPAKRVGVIGAGAAGLAAARCLLDAGHIPEVFEAAKDVGGVWLGRAAWQPVVYDGLVSNLPHQVMQFHDTPFAGCWKSYVTTEEIGRYLCEYAEKFHIKEHCRFNSKVTKVVRDAASGGKWALEWCPADGSGARAQTALFDAVVVCNGHHTTANAPEIPGVAAWLRANEGRGATMTHSSTYRNPQRFAGRVVLVVGARSSGTDIAREASAVAKMVYIMDIDKTRVERQGNRVRVPRGAAVDDAGRIVLHAADPDKRVVLDLPPIDDVLLATGYQYSFPFFDLPSLGMSLERNGSHVTGLDVQLINRKYPDSLFFVGLPMVVAPFPLVEPQARLVAAVLSGTADTENIAHHNRPNTSTLSDDQWEYVAMCYRRARVPDLDAALARTATVRELYDDRRKRMDPFPGAHDGYRYCDYTVDWETGKWSVAVARGAKL